MRTCRTNRSSVLRTGALILMALCVALLSAACDTPDPQGQLDTFVENTADQRGVDNGPDDASCQMGQDVDFSGNYLLGVATSLGLTRPLLFETTVAVDLEARTIDFSFQPIRTDKTIGGEDRDNPRTHIGDPIVANGVEFKEDGTFSVTLDQAVVEGEGNPISGSTIRADLTLNGTVFSEQVFFGPIEGTVYEPVTAAVTGSFGAQATDDVTMTEIITNCPGDDAVGNNNAPNNNAPNNNDMPNNDMPNNDIPDFGPTDPGIQCPEDLAGTYQAMFKTSFQRDDEPNSQVTLTIVEDENPNICYTGTIASAADGTPIGTISSYREFQGDMTLTATIATPPRPDLGSPDPGMAEIVLKTKFWTNHGACGDIAFNVLQPLQIEGTGSMAAVKDDAPGIELSGIGCEGITRTEPCGYEQMAGRYDLLFETIAGVTNVLLDLEEHPLTCLTGNYVSKDTGNVLAHIQSAVEDTSDDSTGGMSLKVRNFVVPAGSNPIFPEGGLTEADLNADMMDDNTFCGRYNATVLKPSTFGSDGTFNAGRTGGNEPGMEETSCPGAE